MPSLVLKVVLLVLLLAWSAPVGAAQPAAHSGVVLPMVLDYPLIRSLMIKQVFGRPGGELTTATENGCSSLRIWGPEVGPALEPGLLRLILRVAVKAGLGSGQECSKVGDWSGYLELVQKVHLQPGTWRLELRTKTVRLYDRRGRAAETAMVLAGAVKRMAADFLGDFTIDLAEPLGNFSARLPLFFAPAQRQKISTWLKGIRPGQVQVEPVGLKVEMLAPPAPRALGPAEPPEPSRPLSGNEIERFHRYWETWDAFLVHQMMALKGQPLSDQERDVLLDILLGQRHGFIQALSAPHTHRDLVREQFLATWQKLGPIMRRHLLDTPTPHLLKLVAFFTAADALAILDKLGPGLGLDISQEGLHRLAELVLAGRAAKPLDYGHGVNSGLRSLLGLGPMPDTEKDKPPFRRPPIKRWEPPQKSWLDWIITPAHAATPPKGYQVDKWLPPSDKLEPYLSRVRKVLHGAVETVIKDAGLSLADHKLFHSMAQATAWQESCWRQFIKERGRVTYLLSYNHSSVGLMQVNERVWRGIYDRQRLRWSINYNAAAGCEILKLYLTRYALKRRKQTAHLPQHTMAGLIYAMYNGGPSQFDKYLRRAQVKRFFLSDRLFMKKYDWVTAGAFDQLGKCLFGRVAD